MEGNRKEEGGRRKTALKTEDKIKIGIQAKNQKLDCGGVKGDKPRLIRGEGGRYQKKGEEKGQTLSLGENLF